MVSTRFSRRDVLKAGTVGGVVAALFGAAGCSVGGDRGQSSATKTRGARAKTASTITTGDGTEIFFKDWGEGQPVVFSHGWPLNADAWESQMLFLAQNGYRVIGYDRRGHGRSSQPSGGNDMDTYADDLASLIEALDLEDATLVGHSSGGGDVTRYIGRHGTSRVAKAVLVDAVPHEGPRVRRIR